MGTAGVVLVVLVWELIRPSLARSLMRARALLAAHRAESPPSGYDPGRERRAEQRARELLRSCVPAEDWEMYRELGVMRVWGTSGGGGETGSGAPHAYLIYPHKPIVAYVPQTGELLSEYCVAFPDESRPYGSARLPDSDDVLAKWMALTGDERRLIGEANMHLPGRQVEPERVRRDLVRIGGWERARAGEHRRGGQAGERANVPAP
ncbi:MAG: hypothetical protein ACYDC2_13105 [Solirubrobacteraceae bacterium]